MYKGKTLFQSPTWQKALAAGFLVLIAALNFLEFRKGDLSWVFVGLLALFAVTVIGLAAVYAEQIELDENELRITHNFQRTTVPLSNIERVTWAKGCNAMLTLKDGGTIKLSEVGEGSQRLCNSISAWIKAA